jgi:L-threonylcarbamoyladenylate synthase
MIDSRIVQIDALAPELSITAQACEILTNGGLIVAPTETRYGLLSRIDRSVGVERLFAIKGRDKNKPSAVFVPSISNLKQLAVMSAAAGKLAERFLPGPLTLVLKSKEDYGPFFTLKGLTGFRISSSPVISAILDQSQCLLSATSANISGGAEPETVAQIVKQLGDKIDLYLDAGRLNNPPSTVVQVFDNNFKILRAGAISEAAIRKALK